MARESARGYAIDTNLYIAAYRSDEAQQALDTFVSAETPFLHLTAVVAQELLAGVRSAPELRKLDRHLIDVFVRRGRFHAPSAAGWRESGAVLSALVQREGLELTRVSKAFGNDVLLAVTCREHGLVLITENTRDFARIAKYVDFRFEAPWPLER